MGPNQERQFAMKNTAWRFKASRFMGAFVALSAATAGISTAEAANRIFNLHLYNADYKPVTFTIMKGGSNCYEGTPGLGEIFSNIAPGQSATITIARVQGHGCDGKNGQFGIEFDPGVGHRNIQYFAYSNDGGLWLHPTTNAYPGKLSPKGSYPRNVQLTGVHARFPNSESYTYSTFARPKPVAGRPVGEWQLICQGYCNETVTKEISNSTTREKSQSSETTEAVSIALEAGLDFPGGGSAKTTMTASQEKKVGQSMSESISRGETNTKGKNVVITATDMRDLGIFGVWQWIAKTSVRTGAQVEQIVVTTDKLTCTADASPPTYLPGAPQDIQACTGGLAAARQAAEKAAQQKEAELKAAQDKIAADQAAARQAAAQQAAAQQAAAQQAAANQAAQAAAAQRQVDQQRAAQQLAQQQAAQQATQQAAAQLAALKQATEQLAAQQKATQLAAQQLAAQQQAAQSAPQTQVAPAVSSGGLFGGGVAASRAGDIAPNTSAVSITMPPGWAKADAGMFDVSVADPSDEVQVSYKFMTTASAASDVQGIVKNLSQVFGTLAPKGAASNTEISGMKAEMREFTGKVNSPGNPSHGKDIDVGMVLMYAPRNQVVGMFAIGIAEKSSKHRDAVLSMLQAIKPR
jgi:hypothetical protein